MNRIVVILVSGLAVILMFLIGVIIYAYVENRAAPATAVTPTPIVPAVTVQPSPTVAAPNTFRGSILAISPTPVGYKNSLVLTLETVDGLVSLYVTPQTRIFNTANNIVPRTTLAPDMNISVVMIPAEGAYEATEIQITSNASVSPTPAISR